MEPVSPVLAGGVFTTEPLGGNPSPDDFNAKAGLTRTGLKTGRQLPHSVRYVLPGMMEVSCLHII